jgi:soluble lytic murein transglycosylase
MIVHSASRSDDASPPEPWPGWRGAAILLVLQAAAPSLAAEPLCNALSDLGNAAESLRRGDTAASIPAARAALSALPRGSTSAHASATLGLALLQARRPSEALDPLQASLFARPAGLEGELRLALGRALLQCGRPAEAARLLADPSHALPATRWLEAEALLAAGRVATATQRFEALLASDGADTSVRRGRLLLAGAWRLAGRTGEALAAYRTLAIEEADWPEGSEAAAALQGWAAAGGTGAHLSGDDRLRRAERLLQRGRHAESLGETALAAGTDPPPSADRVALVQALALAGLDRFGEAVELARALTASSDPGVRRGSQWLQARWASRAGQTAEAAARYLAVAESPALVPGLSDRRSRDLAEESAYLAAWVWYDAGDFGKATVLLDRFVGARPTSPRADDARWFAAWSRVRAGDRRDAQSRLARLENGPLADAALYWGGRFGGSSAWARGRLRQAALAGGDGWYGWLARRRLENLGARPPPRPPLELRVTDRLDDVSLEGLRSAAATWAVGNRDGAVRALETLAQRGASRATAVEICRLATFAGEPALAFRVARDLLGQAHGTERWLYPAAFEELVAPAARAAGVDESLLLALVRRESGFRPEALSSAGAVGLGQLLPRTAERLGQVAELASSPTSLLGDPATNLPLAALYLGLLQDRFGNDAAAVAAYNAGPTPPATWSTLRAGQPLDEWIESVPYKETRIYLKTVLAAREVYRRLAGLRPQLDPASLVPAPAPGVAF